jgi:hypothetical protein
MPPSLVQPNILSLRLERYLGGRSKLPEIRYLDQKSEEWKSISVLVPSRQLRKHITDEVLKVYESLCRARQDA